jgi:hypothetical protein
MRFKNFPLLTKAAEMRCRNERSHNDVSGAKISGLENATYQVTRFDAMFYVRQINGILKHILDDLGVSLFGKGHLFQRLLYPQAADLLCQ